MAYLFGFVPAIMLGGLWLADHVANMIHNRQVDRMVSRLGNLPRVSPATSETRSFGVR